LPRKRERAAALTATLLAIARRVSQQKNPSEIYFRGVLSIREKIVISMK
jgi:hypothetical protein